MNGLFKSFHFLTIQEDKRKKIKILIQNQMREIKKLSLVFHIFTQLYTHSKLKKNFKLCCDKFNKIIYQVVISVMLYKHSCNNNR